MELFFISVATIAALAWAAYWKAQRDIAFAD